jgi:hypothetical protein
MTTGPHSGELAMIAPPAAAIIDGRDRWLDAIRIRLFGSPRRSPRHDVRR